MSCNECVSMMTRPMRMRTTTIYDDYDDDNSDDDEHVIQVAETTKSMHCYYTTICDCEFTV